MAREGMVDALREAQRILMPSGVLVDVRPVVAPLVIEVFIDGQPLWTRTVHAYSAPDDIAAADAAMQQALACTWFVFQASVPFDFEIYCDTAAELKVYAEARKLCGAEVPYEELEQRRHEFSTDGKAARLRCRRPWMLSTYRRA